MIVEPKTKRMEAIMSIQVCLIWWMNFIIRKIVERKAFLASPKHQYHASQWGEHDCNATKKRMDAITSIQVCFISWVNINYKENEGKKSFSCKTKASISFIPIRRMCLQGKIMKILEIMTRIHVCLFWQTNSISKESSGKEGFSCKTKALILFI